MLIVGDSGSGKTVLIQNILLSLAKQLSPKEFNFYILDYSSRMLKLFKSLPHCGAVLQEEDSESLDEFFKLVNSIISQRKKLFSELEVDNFEAARAIMELPLILVIIDNITGLTSSKTGEAHSYRLQSYIKDSANYGIKYIITCSHLNDISSRIRQELEARISLHMGDKYDYNEFLGCKVSYMPSEVPGRGLINIDGKPLEFQSAIFRANSEERARTQYMKDILSELCANYGTQAEAPHLPVFSETATYEEFSRQFVHGRIPLGYAKQNRKPISLPLKQFSALSLYFGNPLGIKPITENIIFAANREGMNIWIVKRSKDSIFEHHENDKSFVCAPECSKLFTLEAQSIDELRSMLTKQIAERNEALQKYCSSHGLSAQHEDFYKKTFDFLRKSTTPIMLFIENFADFCKSADNISALIFDKCFSIAQQCNIYVIGCFEPEDHNLITSRSLYYGFNPEAITLLLGGQFDKQDICVLPTTDGLDKVLQYNIGLMSYRNQFYPISIPCGELLIDEVDEDDQSIF